MRDSSPDERDEIEIPVADLFLHKNSDCIDLLKSSCSSYSRERKIDRTNFTLHYKLLHDQDES